ncbi:MAG: hypothetical protein KIS92_20885 [Planctomycetota bacterium]|nr:hypothetical protein [Planctomycetota bacterium]
MKITAIVCVLLVSACYARARSEEPAGEASATMEGSLRVRLAGKDVCVFRAGAFDPKWSRTGASPNLKELPADRSKRTFRIKSGSTTIQGEAAFAEQDGALSAAYGFTPDADVALNALYVGADFGIATLAGGAWTADDKKGEFPKEFNEVHLFAGAVKQLKLTLAGGQTLEFAFPEATQVLLQDSRKWGPNFEVRIGPQGDAKPFKKGERVGVAMTLKAAGPIALADDGPVTIAAGPEWIPLNLELEIEEGSALDFSKMGLQDAPAGKHGRVIARPDGQFAFEHNKETPRRFYGVNLCFSAHYLTHEQSDQLATRLARLGYNSVRVHHYEGELVSGQADATDFNPEKIDQLDYLLAALIKRGLYITTDLFVSRPVPWKDVGLDKPGNIPMDTFKIMVPVHDGARKNWVKFSRKLLEHVNPYTQRSYAAEPALAWISMINEGNFGNYLGAVRGVPEWKTAWNAWLAGRYPEREKLAASWGAELKAEEDPAKGSVEMPANIYADGPRVRDCAECFADVEKKMVEEMTKFLREDLKCAALITNMNAWTNHISNQRARMVYDYVDDHFYVDHPHFLENPWRLPSSCPNTSPIAGGATGGRGCTFTRLYGKPFTITEYNYSGPGRFRGVGGILTGALGSLQGWGGIWRFGYSHNRESVAKPQRITYFDMASDPLSQASERASICLFLRGDMKPAPHSLSILMTDAEMSPQGKMPSLSPRWNWAAWITRVGTQVGGHGGETSATAVLPVGEAARALAKDAAAKDLLAYSAESEKLFALLKDRGIVGAGNRTDPEKQVYQSETGEITIDAPNDIMTLDTPRTAGGYAPEGKSIDALGGKVNIAMLQSDSTVFVNALDGQAIAESARLLVTHLTDLQNTEIRYGEKARQTLLDWGKLPHLVRAGKAQVKLALKDAAAFKVYALATSGKRLGEVKSEAKDGVLTFTADVSGGADQGARMLYEIAKE